MKNKSLTFFHPILFTILIMTITGCGLQGYTEDDRSPSPFPPDIRSHTAAPHPSNTPQRLTPTLASGFYASPGSPAAISTDHPLEPSISQPETLPNSTVSPDAPFIQTAIRDLQVRLNVALDKLIVVSVESVQWSDTSLGCPEPGLMYSQVVTPGYRVTLQAMNSLYTYHTDAGDRAILCDEEGQPVPTDFALPEDPDIDDGQPWIPAD